MIINPYRYAGGGGAIEFVNAEDFGRATTTNSGSYTVGSGDNRLLIMAVASGQSSDITECKYNSVSMTLAGTAKILTVRTIALYYMVDPPSGAHTATVTGETGQYAYLQCADYVGVGSFDTVATTTASTNTAFNVPITTGIDNCWVIMNALAVYDPVSITAGTDTVKRVTGPFDENGLFDSNAAITPAGATSLNYNLGASQLSHAVIASFVPA